MGTAKIDTWYFCLESIKKTLLSENFWFRQKLEGIPTPSLQLRRWGYDNRLISRNRPNLDTDKDFTRPVPIFLIVQRDHLTLERKKKIMIDKAKQDGESQEGLSTRLSLQGMNDIDFTEIQKKVSARPKLLFWGGSLRNERGRIESPGDLFCSLILFTVS